MINVGQTKLKDIRPMSNDYYSLGSSNNEYWKDLYLSGSLKDGTNSVSISQIALKSEIPTVPTKTSDLTNDSGYLTEIPTASGTVIGGIKTDTGLYSTEMVNGKLTCMIKNYEKIIKNLKFNK